MKRIAIVQSNYIPWKGYFDLIAAVDEFFLFDDTQYTRRDWRNRNLIKTPQGLKWLTIPVEVKGKYHQKICETRVSDPSWGAKHWGVLRQHYRWAPFFNLLRDRFEPIYLDSSTSMLSETNSRFISVICEVLGIGTPIAWSMDYPAESSTKTARLVEICQRAGATHYLSGPSARDYIEANKFADAGIQLEYADYSGYPEYPQLYGEFEHGVSVLDLLFNMGDDAPKFMKLSSVIGAA